MRVFPVGASLLALSSHTHILVDLFSLLWTSLLIIESHPFFRTFPVGALLLTIILLTHIDKFHLITYYRSSWTLTGHPLWDPPTWWTPWFPCRSEWIAILTSPPVMRMTRTWDHRWDIHFKKVEGHFMWFNFLGKCYAKKSIILQIFHPIKWLKWLRILLN